MAEVINFPGSEGRAIIVEWSADGFNLIVTNGPPIRDLPMLLGSIDQAISAAVKAGLEHGLGLWIPYSALEGEIERRIGRRP
jgi:hypothetical protein